jgi:hypothetical protein
MIREQKMSDADHIAYQPGADYAGAEQLIDREKEYLKNHRSDFDAENIRGLALSGGGIRSASFCLGVLQGLAAQGVLKKFDYLSTVSGGGYLGGSLSWLWSGLWKDKSTTSSDFGVDADNFPYGTEGRKFNTEHEDLNRQQASLLRHLRQHGKYLTPGSGIDALSFASIVLRSVFMGFGSMLLLCGFVFSTLYALDLFELTHATSWFFRKASLLALLAYLVLHVMYMINVGRAKRGGDSKQAYLKRRWFESWMPVLLRGFLVFLLFGLIHWVYFTLDEYVNHAAETAGAIAAVLGGVLGSVRVDSKWRKYMSLIPQSAQLIIAAILMIFGILVLADAWSNFLIDKFGIFHLVISALLAVAVLALAHFLPINNISIHRYYRDRLMETFMPDAQKVFDNSDTRAAILANQTGLHELDRDLYLETEKSDLPYHLINTNVILVESKIAKFRGRGGDNFILSPLYSGSNATGWRSTREFCDGSITLPSAVAISGAAANPNAGVAGHGLTTNAAISTLMSIFNLRLGYWACNPDPTIQPDQSIVPSYYYPGLWEIFKHSKMNEKAEFVQLSDGGHFENLALYELVRRRAALIVVCDAGADPQYEFGDLANAIEKARVDFGAEIVITKNMLEELIPETTPAQSDMKYPVAKKSYLVADIKYGNYARDGKLVYIKTTLARNLGADIHGYKRSNPDFPDQTTVDQFFDEVQFEAYRELGRQIVRNMMEDPEVMKLFNKKQPSS